MVGTWDTKDMVYCYAALHVITGKLTPRLVEQPAQSKTRTGQSKTRRLQLACAAHVRAIARAYPADTWREVIITIDKAPWHRGAVVEAVLADSPHLRLSRLPSSSPHLNPIERFWRVLRRRATHNRLFTTRAELRHTLRQNLCSYQSMRQKVLSLIERPRKKKKSQS